MLYEVITVSTRLGVDPRHSDQQVRGTVVLPHGTGKSVRVLVVCRGDKEKEALEAGADFAGFEEYIKKMQEGWLDVDAIVATPDVMGEVGDPLGEGLALERRRVGLGGLLLRVNLRTQRCSLPAPGTPGGSYNFV